MAANILQELRQNPEAEEVRLEGRGLRSLERLLPALAALPRLRRLSLADNELTGLPTDMSSLPALESLDLRGNSIASASDVVHGLLSLLGLRELWLRLPRASEEQDLVASIPMLERFNGVDLLASGGDGAAAGAAAAGQQWTARERAEVTALFAAARPSAGRRAEAQFHDYLARIETHVTALTAATGSPAVQRGETLKARRMMYEFCGDACERALRDAEDKPRVRALCDYSVRLLDDYDAHWRALHRQQEEQMSAMRADLARALSAVDTLLAQQQRQQQGQREASTTTTTTTPGGGRAHVDPNASSGTPRQRTRSGTPSYARPLHGCSRTPRGTGGTTSATPRGGGGSPRRTAGPHSAKVLTLKQLKDAIEDIYASKAKYDARCREHGLPRETVEQHTYTYLNQRFGLREIIVEWVTALFAGVKRYAPLDCDVAVFGKILRNEIDEDFRVVQQQVRETVRELLRAHLRQSGAASSDREAETLTAARAAGALTRDEWHHIVSYMYNADDSRGIAGLIADMQRGEDGPRGDGGVLYADLVRVLLDFQLDRHERFLRPFVRLFRRHDADGDGIVSRAEFLGLAREVDGSISDAEALQLWLRVCPATADAQQCTFSDAVAALGERLIRLPA